jgi:hypothetical protein
MSEFRAVVAFFCKLNTFFVKLKINCSILAENAFWAWFYGKYQYRSQMSTRMLQMEK